MNTNASLEISRHPADQNQLCKVIFTQLARYGQSLKLLQDTLAELSCNTDQTRLTAQVTAISQDNQATYQRVSEKLDQLTQDAHLLSSTIENLAGITERIQHASEAIESIAMQTSVLSLNATIEAAHAGESGKGFSVVAAEVKTLANQTNQSAQDIAEMISQARDMMSQTRQQAQKTLESVASFNADKGVRENSISQLINLSRDVDRVVKINSLRSFVEMVKMDHLVWKMEIYQVLMGGIGPDSVQLTEHRHCRLGKWYYGGAGHEQYSSCTEFQQLEKPHQRLHESGLAALAAYEKEDLSGLELALEHMENASLEVLRLLEKLAARFEQPPAP